MTYAMSKTSVAFRTLSKKIQKGQSDYSSTILSNEDGPRRKCGFCLRFLLKRRTFGAGKASEVVEYFSIQVHIY